MKDYPGIQYVASDGKIFKTMELAMDHEDKLEEDAEKKKKYSEEQARRANEVNEAYDKYQKLKKQYYKDYPLSDSRNNFFRDLFDF